jgi:hypothetical protein
MTERPAISSAVFSLRHRHNRRTATIPLCFRLLPVVVNSVRRSSKSPSKIWCCNDATRGQSARRGSRVWTQTKPHLQAYQIRCRMACHARAHARKSLMPVWRASSGLNSMPLVGNCTGNVRLLRASPSRWATRTVLSSLAAKQQTTNLGVGGSNPSGRASLRDIPCESHGIHTATVPWKPGTCAADFEPIGLGVGGSNPSGRASSTQLSADGR